MKRLTSALFLIFSSVFMVLPDSVFAQATIGSYRYSDEIAVILFRPFYLGQKHLKTKELLEVDFKSKEINIIDKSSDISWRRVSRDQSYIAYAKKSRLVIYDLSEQDTVSPFDRGITGHQFYWAGNSTVLAGINAKSNAWFSLDLKEEIYQESKYEGQYLWGADWSEGCACVEFEVSDEGHTDHYLLRMVKGELNEVEGRRYLSHSPGGRYTAYGKESEYDDWYNEFIVIDSKKNTQTTFNATSPIKYEQMLWGEGVLRILTNVALLDLQKGETIFSSSLWKDQRPKVGRVPIDLAADPAGYVLRWDMDKKLFLVEDINAGGKIIKTYEKFWGDDGGDAEEESGAKKP